MFIKDTLMKEQALIEGRVSECSRDNPSTVLVRLDYISYPLAISIAPVEEFRKFYADCDDWLEAVSRAEDNASVQKNYNLMKGEDEKTKGKYW